MRDELAEDVPVACITFAPPKLLVAFERELALDVPLYGDPERATYRAFGFERGSARAMFLRWPVWAPYVKQLARGKRPPRPQRDVQQLGGDVVAGPDGIVRWMYAQRSPDDRPSVDELRRAAAG